MLATAERPAAYSESALAALWSRAHTLADALITEGGIRMRVIYPGRPSARAGPDFRDAVLLDETGETVIGDVELHTSAPGWYAHGHDADPNYNGVVLHVVFSPRGHENTRQQSKMLAPIISLESVADDLEGADPNIVDGPNDIGILRNGTNIAAVLDDAGDARFHAKSHGFALDLSHAGPDETLYLGIMDALGYASNRRPFRMLAQRVPFSTLAFARNEPHSTRLLAIKAMLLGASGLMNLVNESERPDELRRLRKRLPKVNALGKRDWHLFRVRPSNHPCRRIIGMAHILVDCLDDGVADTFAAVLSQDGVKALTARLERRPYIGRGRALDMLVNIALPFLHAYASEIDNGELAESAHAAYNIAPKLQENEITREMRRLLNIDRGVKMTARRQQGMIWLYRRALSGRPASQE